jgi:hypothetical protein
MPSPKEEEPADESVHDADTRHVKPSNDKDRSDNNR